MKKDHGQTKENRSLKWKAKITYVPFETGEQKNEAYRTWARLFVKSAGKKERSK